jgi:uncharacterized membrane protein
MIKYLGPALVAVAIVWPGHVRAQAAKAEQGFEICNRTKFTVVYSKALNDRDEAKGPPRVTSEGWFTLTPGQCEVAYPGKLQHRYYLIYAEARGSNRKWAGGTRICVEVRDFKLTGPVCEPQADPAHVHPGRHRRLQKLHL